MIYLTKDLFLEHAQKCQNSATIKQPNENIKDLNRYFTKFSIWLTKHEKMLNIIIREIHIKPPWDHNTLIRIFFFFNDYVLVRMQLEGSRHGWQRCRKDDLWKEWSFGSFILSYTYTILRDLSRWNEDYVHTKIFIIIFIQLN